VGHLVFVDQDRRAGPQCFLGNRGNVVVVDRVREASRREGQPVDQVRCPLLIGLEKEHPDGNVADCQRDGQPGKLLLLHCNPLLFS